MGHQLSENVIEKISDIIGDQFLAADIYKSIAYAINSALIQLGKPFDEWSVFEQSLNLAIRDIEADPQGKLFQRLLFYGPHNIDYPIIDTSDEKTFLSDPECGDCVEFIFSHMINRFQGEIGELLALEPSIRLVEQLKLNGQLPENSVLYWGNIVQERHQSAGEWGGFVKGADGFVVRDISSLDPQKKIEILAVIEIKSMIYPYSKMMKQIDHHLDRLSGGVRFGDKQLEASQLSLNRETVQRIMVRPSHWKIAREWEEVKQDDGVTNINFAEPTPPPVQTRIEQREANIWHITLDWSDDALRQAAFEMTFGYMSKVGEIIFIGDNMPKEWHEMTPKEAGYNAIKMMLYYLIMRIYNYYSVKQQKVSRKEIKANRLYNIYSFGYPIGADHKKMLWWENGKLVEMR